MISENVSKIKKEIQNSKIIAATKYASILEMKELYDCGIHDFGENRVDSFLGKYDVFNGYDICWHFIGHLQRNKCSKVIQKIDYLHSLDNLELAVLINKYRKIPLKCFIQVNISEDENKYGVHKKEIPLFIEELKKYQNVLPVGFMTILKEGLSSAEKTGYFKEINALCDQYHLPMSSMGMSSDYKEAVSCDATFIRLGTVLLGEKRNV